MSRSCRLACLALFSTSLASGLAFAQELPVLTIAPSKVTMLVGETHTFRAVGKDGRQLHNVQWSVSPEGAVDLTTEGDEAILEAKSPSPKVVLTGRVGGDSADASVEVRSGTSLKPGSEIWSLSQMPGCKTGQIIQAVPSANGPDLYVQENCPQGTLIRALTADGRELWRRMMNGSEAPPALKATVKPESPAGVHLRLSGNSVCDSIFPGMTKDKAAHLIDERKLRLEEKQRQSDVWTLEEEGSRCTILFERNTGTVAKKRKTIVTD